MYSIATTFLPFCLPLSLVFLEEWSLNFPETELIVAGLTSRKRVKLETFETFSSIGETIRIRDKNYS